MKCLHFSDDMVFWLALVIFQFFSDENQDIDFSWPFIAIVGGEVETSSMHNIKKRRRLTPPVIGHLKIRWDIVPDCIIDVTSSIKTLILIVTRLPNL